MRVLRAKSVRKYLRFYRLAFRIASPYNIILDGNFIFSALKLKIDIIDRLQKLLQTSSVKLFVLRSVLDELKSVGEKTKSAHAFAEQFCTVLSDEGIQGETPSSRLIAFLERIESGASMSAGTSSESVAATGGKVKGYFVATQDRELRSGLGCIPGVPVLYLNHVTLVLEAPSRASLDFNQQLEGSKVALNEEESAIVNTVTGGSSGSKRKNIVDSSAPSSRLSAAGGGGGGAQQLLGSGLVERHMTTSDAGAVQLRKKAKASAPNPLSAAKPRDDSRSQRKKKKNKFRASS